MIGAVVAKKAALRRKDRRANAGVFEISVAMAILPL
jgi:hypothetical protein